MSEHTFHPIQRLWVSKDDDTMRSCYLRVDGRVSLGDLCTYLDSVIHESVDPTSLMLNFSTIRWEEPATDQERAERAEQIRRSDARREAWERETYLRLKEKFES